MTRRLAAVALAAAMLVACGSEPEPTKSPEQIKQEQAAARERAKQGAVGGQIKAIDKANGVQDTVDAQADATRADVDKQTGEAPATAAPATTPPNP